MAGNQYLLFAVAAVGIITLYLAAVLLFKKNTVQERAFKLKGYVAPGEEQETPRSAFSAFCESMLGAFGVSVEKERKNLYSYLGQAGLATDEALINFLFFQTVMRPILVAIGFVGIVIWLLNMKDATGAKALANLFLCMLPIIIGMYGAKLYVSNRKEKRKKTLERSFPDALDLMLVCIESGVSLDATLSRITRELKKAHPEMTEEFDRLRLELSVLNDRVQALTNLADRTQSMGFRSLVAALIQSEKFGTNLADTLRTLSEDYRVNRMLNAENKAARVSALITLPVIIFIFFPFIILIMAPPIIRITQMGGIFGR